MMPLMGARASSPLGSKIRRRLSHPLSHQQAFIYSPYLSPALSSSGRATATPATRRRGGDLSRRPELRRQRCAVDLHQGASHGAAEQKIN